MSSFNDCPFCRRAHPFNVSIVFENELIVSFVPNMQMVRGHTLVIPKRHVEPPETLTAEEAVAIMHEVERLRTVMLERFGKGVDIWQKSRPDLPQGHNGTKVDHIHFHVLPSNPGDELYEKGIIWTFDHFSPVTEQDLREIVPILQESA